MISTRRLDDNGQPCYGHGSVDFVRGTDAVIILCVEVIRLNMGRWFLDASLGVRWWQQADEEKQILGRMPADVAFARSEIIRALSSVQGVAQVQSLSVDFDRGSRVANIEARILTVYGDTRTITVENIS